MHPLILIYAIAFEEYFATIRDFLRAITDFTEFTSDI